MSDEVARPIDRISTVRRALEEKGSIALYSKHAKTDKPWAAALSEGALEQAFPDYQIEVLDAIESSDKVMVHWRLLATHSGEFRDIKPSNAKIDISGVNVYRFVGDKVVESYGQMDAAGMAQQCEEQARLGDVVINALGRRVIGGQAS